MPIVIAYRGKANGAPELSSPLAPRAVDRLSLMVISSIGIAAMPIASMLYATDLGHCSLNGGHQSEASNRTS